MLIDDGSLDFERQATYTVTVRTTDSGGNIYDETLTINVNDLNEAPTDIAPNVLNVDENTNATSGYSLGTLTTTDEDGGESFTYTVVGGADAVKFSIGGANNDELILTESNIDYETQTSYSVTVRTTDSAGNFYDETLTVNVNDLNETPTDINPNSFAIDENVNTTGGYSLGTLTSTDEDAGESFTYTVVGGADAAKFSIGGTNNDELLLDDSTINNGSLDYETQATYSVTIRTTDSGGNFYDETLTINVNDLNEAPTIDPQTFALNEFATNGTVVGTALAADVDAGDAISYAITGGSGATAFAIDPGSGEISLVDDSQIDYEVTSAFTLTVEVTDLNGLTDSATITINIVDLNDEEILAINRTLPVNEGETATITPSYLRTNDQDHTNSQLIYTLTTLPSYGTIEVNGTVLDGVTTTSFTQFDINNGLVIYRHDSSETIADSFDFTVDDQLGSVTNGTFALAVTPVNDAPVANDDTFTLAEGATYNSPANYLTLNDTDAENSPLNVTLVNGPQHGDLTLNSDGSFSYAHHGGEAPTDTFTYRTTDGDLNSNIATVTINVTPVNDAPQGATETYSAVQGLVMQSAFSLLQNDTDVDSNSLTAILVNGPTHGTLTLNADGTFAYQGNSEFNGIDSFTYMPFDGQDAGNIVTVRIEVEAGSLTTTETGSTDELIGPPEEIVRPTEEPTQAIEKEADETKSIVIPPVATATHIQPPVLDDTDVHELETIKPINDQQTRDIAQQIIDLLLFKASEMSNSEREIESINISSLDGITFIFNRKLMLEELDSLVDQVTQTQATYIVEINQLFTAGAATIAGYILWTIRGGFLTATLLSSMPNWKFIDPLPILEVSGQATEEGDTLTSLLEKANKE